MPFNDTKLKIIIIGPSKIGKTIIANHLSETVDMEAFGEPRPTQGVRILEFEVTNTNNIKTYGNTVDIELWDCSGDHKFESCWPMMRLGVQGVILVCSTSNTNNKDLELMYNYFVVQPKLSAKQCVIFLNKSSDDDDTNSIHLSEKFSKISQVPVKLENGGNRIKIDFSNFVGAILSHIK